MRVHRYFYEAFEGYNTISYTPEAKSCLKYMLLQKIMTNQAEDVYSIVNGKAGVKYAGPEVQAMREVANAHKARSLHKFQEVFTKFHDQLAGDENINAHMSELQANLLESNLIRLIEPFERVQIPHVAKLIDLPVADVEQKLSEMILDKKFHGILDQGTGDLILFDSPESDKTYAAALSTVKELALVVDRLYKKAATVSM
jgi:26S proteasome regulatory subunit N6